MIRHVTRKAAGWLAMIVVATNVTYLLAAWFLDPRSNYRGLRPVRTEDQIDRALAPYNLDPRVPLPDRWWHWFTDVVLHFDWGKSPVGAPVNSEIGFRVVVSGQLVTAATLLSVVAGVALSVFTASRQYGWWDRISQLVSVFLFNVPTAVAALAVVLAGIWLNQHLGWRFLYVAGEKSPTVSGLWPTVADRFQHLVLPTLSLTLLGYVGYHLTQRSLLLDSIDSDYVRTARATGLTRTQAIRRHALRASLIPTATSVAFSIPAIFTGAVITETVFGWNGMGQYFVQTIAKNDVHGAVAGAAVGSARKGIRAGQADVAGVQHDPPRPVM
ncbi:ABC transporter permease [Streptomyces sp. NPDC127079]|uniref:ABC transporter permease n=1 Tax=Streptomyces sp. NPDC127079 TaxID=3347132 RepID=UPI0036642739